MSVTSALGNQAKLLWQFLGFFQKPYLRFLHAIIAVLVILQILSSFAMHMLSSGQINPALSSWLWLWMARATSSLPVPDWPVINTGASEGATVWIISNILRTAGLFPTMPSTGTGKRSPDRTASLCSSVLNKVDLS